MTDSFPFFSQKKNSFLYGGGNFEEKISFDESLEDFSGLHHKTWSSPKETRHCHQNRHLVKKYLPFYKSKKEPISGLFLFVFADKTVYLMEIFNNLRRLL